MKEIIANWDWSTSVISIVVFFIFWAVFVPDIISIWSVTRKNFPTILVATAIGGVILSVINLLKPTADPASNPKWTLVLVLGLITIVVYFVFTERRKSRGI